MSTLERDPDGRNVFHLAASGGNARTLGKLVHSVSKKALLPALLARDNKGRTPAHSAAYCGNLRSLRVLLDACAEAFLQKDREGATVYDVLRHTAIEDQSLAVAHDDEIPGRTKSKLVSWGLNSSNTLGRESGAADSLGPGFADMPFRPLPSTSTFRETFIPFDILDIAISGTQALVVSRGWNSDRRVWACGQLGGTDHKFTELDFGSRPVVRVALSSSHAVVVAQDSCWTWGSNAHGQLGHTAAAKKVKEPQQLDDFLEYRDRQTANAFDALQSDAQNKEILDPLIGCACSNLHTVVFSKFKVWAWGRNKGQMGAKAPKGVVSEPQIIFDTSKKSAETVCDVRCTDLFTAITLGSGDVLILKGSESEILDVPHRAVSARSAGPFLVVLTESNKLIRIQLDGENEDARQIKVFQARRESLELGFNFDVADNGNVMFSTGSVCYVFDGKSCSPVPGTVGIGIQQICCDSQFRSFLGVHNYECNASLRLARARFLQDITAICPICLDTRQPNDESYQFFLGASVTDTFQEPDSKLEFVMQQLDSADSVLATPSAKVAVHKAVISSRCPQLRGVFTQGKILETKNGFVFAPANEGVRLSDVSDNVLKAFVYEIYTGVAVHLADPVELGSLRNLRKLIERDLSHGFSHAQEIKGDFTIKLKDGNISAHGFLLKLRSPFFAAKLSRRWTNENTDIDLTTVSKASFAPILKYLYLAEPTSCFEDLENDNKQVVEALFDVLQVANQLLVTDLERVVQSILLEFIDLELALTMFFESSMRTTLHQRTRQFIIKHMDYFVTDLDEFPNSLLDQLELLYKKEFNAEVPEAGIETLVEKMRSSMVLSPSRAAGGAPSSAITTRSTTPASPLIRPTPGPSPDPSEVPVAVSCPADSAGWSTARFTKVPKQVVTGLPDISRPSGITEKHATSDTGAPWSKATPVPSVTTPWQTPLQTEGRSSQVGSPLPKLGSTVEPARSATAKVPKAGPSTSGIWMPKTSQKERRRQRNAVLNTRETCPLPAASAEPPWKPVSKDVPSLLDHIQKKKGDKKVAKVRGPASVW